jgi:hypothetical protein
VGFLRQLGLCRVSQRPRLKESRRRCIGSEPLRRVMARFGLMLIAVSMLGVGHTTAQPMLSLPPLRPGVTPAPVVPSPAQASRMMPSGTGPALPAADAGLCLSRLKAAGFEVRRGGAADQPKRVLPDRDTGLAEGKLHSSMQHRRSLLCPSRVLSLCRRNVFFGSCAAFQCNRVKVRSPPQRGTSAKVRPVPTVAVQSRKGSDEWTYSGA